MISAPSFDISTIFDQHKQITTGGGSVMKHCSSIFDSNATVAYIPTGIVASGPIRKYFFLIEMLFNNFV
jgi:hypothetical protein